MTTSESSKTGGQGSGARAITRAEDYEVRSVAERCFGGHTSALAWSPDGKRLLGIEVSMGGGKSRPMRAGEQEQLATEGIVPGPAGWCWAAPATRYSCRWNERCTFADKHSGRCSCDGEEQGNWAPPAWLTAEVLAALPADGTPVPFPDMLARINTRGDISAPDLIDDLDALAARGEIERCPEQDATVRWRRWGVPEGWAWRRNESDGQEHLVGIIAGEVVAVATAFPNGGWRAGISSRHNVTKPPTLAAARSAALRACYERGVFEHAAAPKPAPSTPATQPEDRPARLRAALLAVLTPGPVRTGADLLPALDAAMGERAGVAVATGAEAMKAAREVGARVDCVEWSLPPIPDGWGWRRVIASRWYLAPLDASDPEREAVASLAVDDGVGGIGGLMWRVKGEMWQGCASVEEGQAAALQAARLAGLFAAPRAEAAPVAAPAPVEPATTPLDALARRLCGAHLYAAGSPGMAAVEADVAALTPLLAAFRADVVAAAKREDSEAGDPLHRAALAVSAARQRLSAAAPGTDEWSAAEIEVARTTGALLDALGVDAEEVAADARHAQRIAENERDDARALLRAEIKARVGAEVLHRDQSHKAADAERSLSHARRDLETAREAIKRVEGERDTALARAGLDAADRATLDAVGRLREALTALCAGPGAWQWAVDESAPDAAVRLLGEMAERVERAESERSVALSELATLKADLAALHARWATGAKGADK